MVDGGLSGWRVAFAATLLALAAAPGAAAQDAARLTTPFPPVVEGALTVEAASGLLAVGFREGSEPPVIRLEAASLSLTIVRVEIRAVETPLGAVALAPAYRNESWTLPGPVRLVLGGDSPSFLASPAPDGATLRVDAGVVPRLPLETTSEAIALAYGPSMDVAYFHARETPEGALALAASERPLRMTAIGALDAFAANGALAIEWPGGAREWALAEHVGRAAAPAGERVDRYSFARIAARDARLAIDAPAGADASAFLAQPRARIDGAVEFRDAEGAISDGGSLVEATGARVRLEGVLTLAFLPTEHARGLPVLALAVERRYHATGAFEAVRLGAQSLRDEPAAALAGVTLAGVVLASLLRAVRGAFGHALGALYSRIAREDAADSAERQRLLAAIRERPGAHLRGLQRALGFGWGKFSYHVSVLQRAGLVRLERRGRHVHVTPAGIAAGAERFLELRGAAARVLDALAASAAAATQRELAERAGLSRALVSHHLRALAADGLVVEVGGWPKRYARPAALARVDAERAVASE